MLTVLTGTVEQVTRDRRRGVLQEVVGHRLANPTYWAGELVVLILLGNVPALAGAAVVFWLDGAGDAHARIRVLLLIPIAAVSGGLVGLTAAVASSGLSDPYLISNSAHSVLLVTAGVVLPMSLYPQWLAWTAVALPFTAAAEAVRADGEVAVFVARELVVSFAWFGVKALIGRRVCLPPCETSAGWRRCGEQGCPGPRRVTWVGCAS